MTTPLITPRKYGGMGAIKRALGKISNAEVQPDQPMGFVGDSGAHPSIIARPNNTVGESTKAPPYKRSTFAADSDEGLEGEGAPIPGRPSFPIRRTPKNPSVTGF